jgi:glycolate oxidase FAD binding subunit
MAAGYAYGGVRDFVLGARLLDGRGRLLSFGGTVIKNVAGYDAARLLAGSLGVLGVILEVSLKVVPKPAAEATLAFEMEEAAALARMNEWGGRPLPISATAWAGGRLCVRLSGARAAVEAARRTLGGEPLEAAVAREHWLRLREQRDEFFAGDAPLWRLSLPSAAPSLELAEPGLIEWGGAQRWVRTTLPAESVRTHASGRGGHATLFRGGDRSTGVFTPLTPAIAGIHRRLRAEFDPHGVFDAGRMYAGL